MANGTRAIRETAAPSRLLLALRCGGLCALGAVLRLRRPFLEVKRLLLPDYAPSATPSILIFPAGVFHSPKRYAGRGVAPVGWNAGTGQMMRCVRLHPP